MGDPHAQAAAEGQKRWNFTHRIPVRFPAINGEGKRVCGRQREVWGALQCKRQLGVAMPLSGLLECHGFINFYFFFRIFF